MAKEDVLPVKAVEGLNLNTVWMAYSLNFDPNLGQVPGPDLEDSPNVLYGFE